MSGICFSKGRRDSPLLSDKGHLLGPPQFYLCTAEACKIGFRIRGGGRGGTRSKRLPTSRKNFRKGLEPPPRTPEPFAANELRISGEQDILYNQQPASNALLLS